MNRSSAQRRRDRTTHRLVVAALTITVLVAIVRGCGAFGERSTVAAQSSKSGSAAPHLIITTNGVTMPIVGGRSGAWRAMTPCARTVVVAHGELIPTVDVVIDPGHGGEEAGAVAYGRREADLNLAVARAVRADLVAQHVSAALTRTGDYRLPIPTRAAIVNADRPKLFVSVHHNSGDAAPHHGPGTEVYYQHVSSRSRRLAGLIWLHLYASIDTFRADWVGAADAGAIYRLDQHHADYYGVLRRVPETPSVLVEASYVDEPTEAALLRTRSFIAAEAAGIAAGIRAYIETHDQGAGFHTPLQRTFQDNGGGGGTYVGCIDPPIAR